MQTKLKLVCLFLTFPALGTIPSESRSPASYSPQIQSLSAKASALYASGDYLEAAAVYNKGRQEALARGDRALALRFLNNAGGCWFALSLYRKAMDAFLEARELALALKDHEMLGALSLNISSLYLEMGEVAGAAEAAREGLAALRKLPQPKYKVQLLMQVARVKAWQNDLDGAIPLFGQAIAEADRQGDVALQAKACNLLGYELLRKGRIKEAEGPLLEAFRLRKLNRDRELDKSYLTVGLLLMAQGDLRSARALLDEAVAAARRPGRVPRWSPYYHRAQLRMAEGNLRAAVADFRTALDLARRWRLEVIPTAAVRVSMEVELQQLYSGFIEAAVRLYAATRDAALVRESFEAAEENRAASLRALITDPGDWRRGLPAEYAQTLARLRAAEISLLREDSLEARGRVQKLQYELMQMEARAGLRLESTQTAAPGGLLERTQRALEPDEALLSFHLGERESYAWVVTRGYAGLRVLAGRERIAEQVRRFVDAVRSGSGAAAEAGSELYNTLFKGVGESAGTKTHWALALDDVLFSAPLAALVVDGASSRPVYLMELRALQVVPSAHAIAGRLDGAQRALGSGGRFVGVGDAVYNRADPRLRRPAGGSVAIAAGLELARLAGSGVEIRACAKAWGPEGEAVLLEGVQATREGLWQALDGEASVLHMATHVTRKESGSQAFVALSLRPNGEPDWLSAADIAARRVRVGLVVLSGCSSGLGEALPGAGLMGLTRAWLAAGAEAVAASLWPTPDDSGSLFLSFYRHLKERGTRAEALASAQRDMLRGGGWRSLPRYWASYFLFSKE